MWLVVNQAGVLFTSIMARVVELLVSIMPFGPFSSSTFIASQGDLWPWSCLVSRLLTVEVDVVKSGTGESSSTEEVEGVFWLWSHLVSRLLTVGVNVVSEIAAANSTEVAKSGTGKSFSFPFLSSVKYYELCLFAFSSMFYMFFFYWLLMFCLHNPLGYVVSFFICLSQLSVKVETWVYYIIFFYILF